MILTILTLFTIFVTVNPYSDGTKELIFVQTLWRHGDRSPLGTFPTDPFQEDSWTFGGGGWAQLSPLGMKQHFKLGQMLRKRYVDDYGFLPKKYNSKQIYVRSSDSNQTIISAMSNLFGQYGQNDNSSIGDIDYPVIDGWPTGYVPIAVHTVDYDTDHIINQEATCPFRFQVWELAKTSEEVRNFTNSEDVQSVLANLTKHVGFTVTLDNLWVITDSLFVEQIYYNDTLRQKNAWFTDELFAQADSINDQAQLFQNGIFKNTPNIINGHDVGLLARKVQGGPILNDMLMHMNLKLECIGQKTPNCTWINNLKHYIYSGHDTTIYALFSALLIEEYAIKKPGQYPQYSSAVIVELYIDHSENNKPYFKLIYHEEEGSGLKDITMGVQGCPVDSVYCSLDVLRGYAKLVEPDQPINQWCFSDLNAKISSRSTVSIILVGIIFIIENGIF